MEKVDKIQRDLAKSLKRIQELESQEADIQQKIKEEKIAYQAKLDIVKLMERPAPTRSKKSPTLRPGTDLERVRQMLLEETEPLHINEITKRLGKEDTKEAKNSLAGSLSGYVRRGVIFSKPKPNTFGLLEKRYVIEGGNNVAVG